MASCIGSEEDVFPKAKQNILKLSWTKKNLLFHNLFYNFVFPYFSIACQCVFVLYIKKGDSSERLYNSFTIEQLMLDQWR